MCIRTAGLIALLGAVGLMTCTEPMPVQSNAAGLLALRPSGLDVSYNLASGRVECAWVAPSESPAFYRLYRAVLDTSGRGMTELVSDGERTRISGAIESYVDVVGLSNARYVYQIRAVRIEDITMAVISGDTSYDTSMVEGPPSNMDTVFVGSGISFSINRGDLFTRYDTCRLWILDVYSQLDSAVFSGDSMFAATQTLNLAGDPYAGTPLSGWTDIPWTLPKGAGNKVVWARLHYSSGYDTVVSDDIGIEPYSINLKLRNELDGPLETMRAFYERNNQGEPIPFQGGPTDYYVVYKPTIEFSVSIFSDSTFAPEFDYWLVFPDNEVKFAELNENIEFEHRYESDGTIIHSGFNHPSFTWIHTPTIRAQLTGIGAGHDDLHKYRYVLDPDSASLYPHNFGALYFETDDESLAVATPVTGLSPQETLDTLTAMDYAQIRNVGRKEFMIFTRFRGKYFDDERVVVSCARLNRNSSFVAYLDQYPPYCLRDHFEYYYPNDGATIEGAFTINLNERGTIYSDDSARVQLQERGLVWDKGGADVVDIELVIAEMPDLMAEEWNDAVTPQSLTLDSILGFRHRIFEYDIGTHRSDKIYPVSWNNIDPSDWNTGWYLICIVTEDSFGNRGIAPFAYRESNDNRFGRNFNPQHWRIITGQSGF